jgi:hypothetical protein
MEAPGLGLGISEVGLGEGDSAGVFSGVGSGFGVVSVSDVASGELVGCVTGVGAGACVGSHRRARLKRWTSGRRKRRTTRRRCSSGGLLLPYHWRRRGTAPLKTATQQLYIGKYSAGQEKDYRGQGEKAGGDRVILGSLPLRLGSCIVLF